MAEYLKFQNKGGDSKNITLQEAINNNYPNAVGSVPQSS